MSTEKKAATEKKEEVKEVAVAEETTAVNVNAEVPMGFEDEEAGDMIIPRIKVIQTLSPERKDKIANEGDILNSLTQERLNGKRFIPVFKFNNNIDWIDRSEGGGIRCSSRDGKLGVQADGKELLCKVCRRCEFDNSKQGKDAIPKCTKYINFLGFFEGEPMPIILSFGKTNYNEGKKLYSLAKVTMQNMWNYAYTLNEKLVSKSGNEWYIITTAAAGPTDETNRAFALNLYKSFRNNLFNYDVEESGDIKSDAPVDTSNTEF